MKSEDQRSVELYQFHANDPYDHTRAIRLVLPRLVPSREYMQSIRSYSVREGALAVWYLGQNGFLLKDSVSPLIGIDLYLTNSCAQLASDEGYRMDRQLPIFIEPEDLDVDVFLTTHSHQDHADPETISRVPNTAKTVFAGPFDAVKIFEECRIPQHARRLLHPGETLDLGTITVQATFAIPHGYNGPEPYGSASHLLERDHFLQYWRYGLVRPAVLAASARSRHLHDLHQWRVP